MVTTRKDLQYLLIHLGKLTLKVHVVTQYISYTTSSGRLLILPLVIKAFHHVSLVICVLIGLLHSVKRDDVLRFKGYHAEKGLQLAKEKAKEVNNCKLLLYMLGQRGDSWRKVVPGVGVGVDLSDIYYLVISPDRKKSPSSGKHPGHGRPGA